MRACIRAWAGLVALSWATLCFAQAAALSPEQFRDRVIAAIEAHAPGAQVRVRGTLSFDSRIPGGMSAQVNLDRAYGEYQAAPDQVDAIVDRWARLLVSPLPARDAATLIIVLRPADVIASYNAALGAQGGVLVRPFVGDLEEALAFDSPEELQYATADGLDAAGVSEDAAWARAPANVAARMGNLDRTSTPLAGVTLMSGGDGIAPSLLIDPGLCAQQDYSDAIFLVNDRGSFFVAHKSVQGAVQNFWGLAHFLVVRGQSLSSTPLQCRDGRLEAAQDTGNMQ